MKLSIVHLALVATLAASVVAACSGTESSGSPLPAAAGPEASSQPEADAETDADADAGAAEPEAAAPAPVPGRTLLFTLDGQPVPIDVAKITLTTVPSTPTVWGYTDVSAPIPSLGARSWNPEDRPMELVLRHSQSATTGTTQALGNFDCADNASGHIGANVLATAPQRGDLLLPDDARPCTVRFEAKTGGTRGSMTGTLSHGSTWSRPFTLVWDVDAPP